MERSQDEIMNSSDGVRDSQGKPSHVAHARARGHPRAPPRWLPARGGDGTRD